MRDFLRSSVALVWLPVLAAAAAVASLDRGTDTGDLIYFVHKGEQLLSGRWADTFADPALQSGPLQLALAGVFRNFTALAFLIELAVAGLLLFVLARLGVNDRIRLAVGLVAVAAGLTHGAFVDGHPAQAFVPLLWVLAGVWARENRAARAGALVGLSAGLELWGVLGAPVLLLVPRFRRAISAGLVEAAVVAGLLAPFIVFGTFRMFEHEWHVSTGTLMSLFVEPGTGFGWPLRLLQSALALAAGVAIAAGTDFGGGSLRANQLAWEVESLVAAGMEPWEAVGAATWRGGELLGERNAGVIREGGPADFFLVHGDPLSDPKALWRVWRVPWAE